MRRAFMLTFLTVVAWLGALLSKFGAIGQDLREWALIRLRELG